MGSLGSLGGSMDPLGGPMGPWDRWDLGTDGTWASRTPDHKTGYRLYYEVVYRYPARPGPARKFRIPVPDPWLPGPGAGYPAAGPGAGCRLPGRPFLRFFSGKILKIALRTPGIKIKSEKINAKYVEHITYFFIKGAQRTRFSTRIGPVIIRESQKNKLMKSYVSDQCEAGKVLKVAKI